MGTPRIDPLNRMPGIRWESSLARGGHLAALREDRQTLVRGATHGCFIHRREALLQRPGGGRIIGNLKGGAACSPNPGGLSR